MFHTGLEKIKYADVDTFTSDRGIKWRMRWMGKGWRSLLKLCTSRKIIIEQYPQLDKNEALCFCCESFV